MPQYVYVTFGVAAATMPVALWGPALPVAPHVAARICVRLMALGILGLVASGVLVIAFNVWFAAMATIAASLVVFHVMFWLAAPPPRDDGDDEERGDGGSRRPGPPRGPGGPSGIDWDEFDRYRHGWEADRSGRELAPV